MMRPASLPAGHGRSLTGGNVFWSGLEAAVSGGLSCVSAFAIARIIGPAELGIGAAAVAVHVLLWVGVNGLFADALVQRADLSKEAVDSAFWASAGVGCVAGLVQLAAGFALVRALHDPRLPLMSGVLALALPLVGGGGPVQGMLTRARAYRVLAGRAVIGQGLGTAIGIAVALGGAGAWALVLQQLCVSAAGALALLLRAPWRPCRRCRWAEVRALLRLGLPLTASTLVQQGRYRLFALLIGATAGPAALGQVHLAFRLVDTVRDLLMTALWRLLLPAMAEHQHDPPGLLACVDRCLARAGLVVFPICAVMALVMVPLVVLLLGPVWADAGQSAQWLVGLMAYGLLGFPGGVACIARQAPRPQAIRSSLPLSRATRLTVPSLVPFSSVSDSSFSALAGKVYVLPDTSAAAPVCLGVGSARSCNRRLQDGNVLRGQRRGVERRQQVIPDCVQHRLHILDAAGDCNDRVLRGQDDAVLPEGASPR